MEHVMARHDLITRLERAGCVAAPEEADELLEAAAGDSDLLAALLTRREQGEPLAWLTGSLVFAGVRVLVSPGVYVPRRQSEALAIRAAELLPPSGVAADLCTGSGAIAAVLRARRPEARVVASEVDDHALRCARCNGVEVYRGSLVDPLPRDLWGHVDVVVGVVPYVPTEELQFLPRDVLVFEPRQALDGGTAGTAVLERAIRDAAAVVRPGGAVLLEVGGDQDRALADVWAEAGFDLARRMVDEEGDLRGIELRRQEG